MLNVIIPEDNAKLDKQIAALEWQIEYDTSPKDKLIHKEAYNRLVEERERRKNEEIHVNNTSRIIKPSEKKG